MTLYKFSPVPMPNDIENTINMVRTFEIKDVKEYTGQRIERGFLWVFCHGVYDENDIFSIKVSDSEYMDSRDFADFFQCYDSYIIFDSCRSNKIDLTTLSEFKERGNIVFLSGYENELNTPDGSTLNYCLSRNRITVHTILPTCNCKHLIVIVLTRPSIFRTG